MEKIFTQDESSTIKRIKYLDDKSILEVEFRNGAAYHYFNVGPVVAKQALESIKIGSYLNNYIKGTYEYKRVTL